MKITKAEKSNIVRIAGALLLAGAFVLSLVLSGAGRITPAAVNDPVSSTEAGTSAAVTTGQASTDPVVINDEDRVPFRIITATKSYYHIAQSEFSGSYDSPDTLSRAVFERNAAAQAVLPITVTEIASSSPTDDIISDYISGSDSYDAAALPIGGVLSALIVSGYLWELSGLDSIDISSPWYNSAIGSALSIGGRTYILTGALITGDDDSIYVTVYNSKLADTAGYGSGKLENMVYSGEWTLDRLRSVALEACSVISSVYEGYAAYGLRSVPADTYPLCLGAGASITSKGSDDLPVITLDTDAFANIFSKVSALLLDTDISAPEGSGYLYDDALFEFVTLGTLRGYVEYNVYAGILPIPMYENDIGYTSPMSAARATGIAIPLGHADAQGAGYIISRMSDISQTYITQAYDSYFSFNSGTSLSMMTLVRASAKCDIVDMFGWGNIASALASITEQGGSIEDFRDTASVRAALAEKAMSIVLKRITASEAG